MATKKARPDEATVSEDLIRQQSAPNEVIQACLAGPPTSALVPGQAGDRNTICTYALELSYYYLLDIHFREFITLAR